VKSSELLTGSIHDPQTEPWLPEVIEKNPKIYVVLPELEVVDGRSCHVIEYPKFDKVWIDAERGFAVVRRETCWAEDYPLRRRITNLDHRFHAVPGLWLPQKQVHEQFCSPRDVKEHWGKVSHTRTHAVKSIDFEKIDDAMLEVKVPDGSLV